MKDKVRELYERLRDAVVKLQNETGGIEISTTYANANNIMMNCLIDGVEPTSEEMDFIIFFVEYYEERAISMVPQ